MSEPTTTTGRVVSVLYMRATGANKADADALVSDIEDEALAGALANRTLLRADAVEALEARARQQAEARVRAEVLRYARSRNVPKGREGRWTAVMEAAGLCPACQHDAHSEPCGAAVFTGDLNGTVYEPCECALTPPPSEAKEHSFYWRSPAPYTDSRGRATTTPPASESKDAA